MAFACVVAHSSAFVPVSLRTTPSHDHLETAMLKTSALSYRRNSALYSRVLMNMSRKEKNKLKKVERVEKQKEAAEISQKTDALLDDLFDQIEATKRDLSQVTRVLNELSEYKPDLGRGNLLHGDWKLAFVNKAECLDEFGTGLGKLPGTSILDMFVSFDSSGKVKLTEVCRVVGPFPNVKNELMGEWTYSEGAVGFNKDAAANGLRSTYSAMLDGRNKMTDANTGFRVRTVASDVKYVDQDVMVIFLEGGGEMVWEREEALTKELGRLLRQDLTKEPEQGGVLDPISAVAEIVSPSGKKPWEFWKK